MNILVLDSTSKSLRSALSEAITTNQLDFTIHYADMGTNSLTEGNHLATSNGVTNVEVLPAPSASTRRVIKNVTIYNKDTVSHTVSLFLRNSVTDYLVVKQTLDAGESWAFGEADVHFVTDDYYLIKSGLSDWDEQSSTPTSPASTKMKLYFKDDERLYQLNPSGVERKIATDDGGGWTPEHFANGALGFYSWSSITYDSALRWQRSTRFFAERGMAIDDRLTTLTSDGKDPQPIKIKRFFHNVGGMETLTDLVAWTDPEIRWRNPFQAYYMDDEMIAVADCIMSLVRAIREHKSPEYGPVQARSDQEVMLAVYESAKNSGASVRLPIEH